MARPGHRYIHRADGLLAADAHRLIGRTADWFAITVSVFGPAQMTLDVAGSSSTSGTPARRDRRPGGHRPGRGPAVGFSVRPGFLKGFHLPLEARWREQTKPPLYMCCPAKLVNPLASARWLDPLFLESSEILRNSSPVILQSQRLHPPFLLQAQTGPAEAATRPDDQRQLLCHRSGLTQYVQSDVGPQGSEVSQTNSYP